MHYLLNQKIVGNCRNFELLILRGNESNNQAGIK